MCDKEVTHNILRTLKFNINCSIFKWSKILNRHYKKKKKRKYVSGQKAQEGCKLKLSGDGASQPWDRSKGETTTKY